jgi:hypothetical protein
VNPSVTARACSNLALGDFERFVQPSGRRSDRHSPSACFY